MAQSHFAIKTDFLDEKNWHKNSIIIIIKFDLSGKIKFIFILKAYKLARFFQEVGRISKFAALRSGIFPVRNRGEFYSYLAPIMSNRTNGNGWEAFVYGGVSAGRTTALWFCGWPWPWRIDQPVKPGSRHDYEGSCSTISPRFAKIPGEIPGPYPDPRLVTTPSTGFSYFYYYSYRGYSAVFILINSQTNYRFEKK